MALAPLATATDLEVKGVDTSTNPELVAWMLDVASSIIREAAGNTISEATSTIKLLGPEGKWLRLPGHATAVTTVLIDGEADADWKFINGMLWRWCGWSFGRVLNRPFRRGIPEPVEVTVTYTHDFAEWPADIRNLCADLAKLGIESVGQDVRPAGVISTTESIDDHSETVQYAASARTLMELPEATQEWLAQRFGGGVYVTGELK